MAKRKRTKLKIKFQSGDLVWAKIPGIEKHHLCIILNDTEVKEHRECLPICNFTGSPTFEKEQYVIDVSIYSIPDRWFESEKPNKWIRCNDIDCIKAMEVTCGEIIGNIKDEVPELWKDVCRAVMSCEISDRLSNACECEYEEFQSNIELGKEEMPSCECET